MQRISRALIALGGLVALAAFAPPVQAASLAEVTAVPTAPISQAVEINIADIALVVEFTLVYERQADETYQVIGDPLGLKVLFEKTAVSPRMQIATNTNGPMADLNAMQFTEATASTMPNINFATAGDMVAMKSLDDDAVRFRPAAVRRSAAPNWLATSLSDTVMKYSIVTRHHPVVKTYVT